MRIVTHSRRSGFTLLEVLLASAIASLLFGALYVGMYAQLRQQSEGRDAIEKATLARAVINRMSLDLAPSMTPPRAKPKAKASSSSSSSSTSTSSTSTTSTDTSADTAAQLAEALTMPVPLQAGVIGEADRIVIFTTRVPDPKKSIDNPGESVPSDIRRISYWIGSNGGLCRQEIPYFSGDQVQSARDYVLEDGKTDDDYMIAGEVTELGFEYFDINGEGSWLEYWDGTIPGPDGRTPIGPPSAIRIRFVVRTMASDGEESTKEYRHIIPIITASGPDTAELTPADGEATDPTGIGTTGTPGTTTP